MIQDAGCDAQSRVTVFASRQALELLSRSSTWNMDGTFAAAPCIYTQFSIIRAELGTAAVMCLWVVVFLYTVNKSYATTLSVTLSFSFFNMFTLLSSIHI